MNRIPNGGKPIAIETNVAFKILETLKGRIHPLKKCCQNGQPFQWRNGVLGHVETQKRARHGIF